MFTDLPVEVIRRLLDFLQRQDICQLLYTCRTVYQIGIAQLYHHLFISDYIHVRQLQYGVRNGKLLRETIQRYTNHLTLSSKRNGSTWRISDLLQIIGPESQITKLVFSNYNALSTKMIQEVIEILPHIQHVEFKYCHIVYSPSSNSSNLQYILNPISLANRSFAISRSRVPKLKSLSFIWTEFPENFIASSLYSHITRLNLGANRNKYLLANETMAKAIATHCPNVTHLSITLPQVSEACLCDTLMQYGAQLQQLSIRCDSYRLLDTIVSHNKNLTHLTLRISPTADHNETNSHLLNIIQECQYLIELEIYSCHLEQDVPLPIWRQIASHAFMYSEDVIARAEKICAEGPDMSTSEAQTEEQAGDAFGISSRVLFDLDVFEDALQQRYLYNLTTGNKQTGNIPEKLMIYRSLLQNYRFHIPITRITN